MEYVIPVDFSAWKPTEFHSQWVGTEEQGVNGCFLICTRVPPGTGTAGVHTHLGDQFYFIMEGDMNLQLGENLLKATKDDLIFIPTAVPHKNFNTSEKDEIHFEFIVPGAFPGLARSYRAQWPEYELKETVNPHYVRSLDRSKFDPNKTSHVTMADYKSGSHHARIDIVQVPEGQGNGDIHQKDVDQVYWTMTGEMVFQIGNDRYTVPPHNFVYIPAGVPHMYLNTGGETASHIYCQVPEEQRSAS